MLAALAVGMFMVAAVCAAPASADDPPPGCERVPIFGLSPQVRKICDEPVQPDGSWVRARQFSHPEFVHSTCGDYGYMTRTGYVCPWWAPRDAVPAHEGPIETYVVTADTIPPGEPGHLGP